MTEIHVLESSLAGARLAVQVLRDALLEARKARALSDPAALERYCEIMHEAYEAAAVDAGWSTQPTSRRPWAFLPEPNKVTMRAAVTALLNEVEAR